MNQKENVILADCERKEIQSFVDGCNEATSMDFHLKSSIANGHAGIIQNLRRYFEYFLFPLKNLRYRRRYGIILGWQQFYAINYAFFCRLFWLKKQNTLVALNFTYKRKSGILGTIYHKYMKFSCMNKYLDYFHVPSNNYVARCCDELGLKPEQFIVTGFGVPDTYEEMKGLTVDFGSEYTLSIGRSNRDFDFLVNMWRQDCLKSNKLVIASDVWKPTEELPPNVTFRNNISYEESFAWFNNCSLCITPIDDGNICSGDTVLLTAMMFGKPVAVTYPSTLAEMYVTDNVNGLCLPKDAAHAAEMVATLLNDSNRMNRLGTAARNSFETKHSRRSMAHAICKILNTGKAF